MRNNKEMLPFFSFVALVFIALLVLVNSILPHIGIIIDGLVFRIISLIKDVLVLFVVGALAYTFIKPKTKAWVITYWVSIIIFVAALVISLF